jgi:hypothetical protein
MPKLAARGAVPLLCRIGVVAAATMALSGCIFPPIVTLATTSINIVSWAATGKTVTDHAYSAVARADCSSTRILHGKPYCVPPDGDAIAVAANPPPQDAATPALAANAPTEGTAANASTLSSIQVASLAPLPAPTRSTPSAGAVATGAPLSLVAATEPAPPELRPPAVKPGSPPLSYVSIGSFLDRANAERSLARFAEFHPTIVPATVNGQVFNRVVAGPLTKADAVALKSRLTGLAANGIRRAGRSKIASG